MVGLSPMDVRALIAEFAGDVECTLRRAASSCSVLAAIATPSLGGNPSGANSMIAQDTRRAFIAAVDADGAPIALVPTFGDHLERGAVIFGIGRVRTEDPDGTAVAYIAELQS
jgi:hypothetical protein